MLAVCGTGVNQAPSYEKDLVDDRYPEGSVAKRSQIKWRGEMVCNKDE